jgi:glycosyltransferase involved in cell wall biosynthesis
MSASPIHLMHIITGLDTGGAETMLYRLLSRMDRDAFRPEVISLTDVGAVGGQIAALGITVHGLGMRRGFPDPLGVLRLAHWLRQARPRLVQTWLYHGDLVGGLANLLGPRVPLAWNIRNLHLRPEMTKASTLWTAKACARLSRLLPERIVCCSQAAGRLHAGLGYAEERMRIIPNGFQLDAFAPDPRAYREVRAELGLAPDALLIGLVARWDPVKDHRNFVEAAALLHAAHPAVHFLLCGAGIDGDNPDLAGWIERAGLEERFHLLGRREDMPRINAALDLATLASSSEAFPNVVGEAMACGVPCVATDVGDAALIVGDTGRVVPPRDPEALSRGWQALLALGPEGRRRLGARARRRIEAEFELGAIVGRYEALYRGMLGGAAP